MRKFLLLIALIISGLGLNAQSVGDETIINYEGYSLKFTVTNLSPAECSVTCSTEPIIYYMAVTIPASVEIEGTNFNVTSIGDEAFSGRSSLTSIEIPSGVTSIGDDAFYFCDALTSIEIPSGVTSIGSEAFRNCSSLTSIEIPSGVTSIPSRAFYNCDALTSVTFGENSQLTSIGYYAFSDCDALTSIEIPSGVTSIGEWAFSLCSSLTSIEIPSGVTSIGYCAFYLCSSLTSIEIPSGVTSIGDYAFSGCSSLTSIEIPSGVTFIGYEAFKNCSNLTSIEIPSGVTSIGERAFSSCYDLESVTFGENSQLASIGDDAFSGCSSLTSIEIPSGVTSIGLWAFSGCSSLTSIEIPSGVTSIGLWAFSGCSSLTSIKCHAVEVPETSQSAFNNCPENMTIQVPAGSVEAYQAASPWRNYNIVALPEIGDNTIIDYAGYSLKFTVTNLSPAECSVICSTHPTSSMAVTIPASVEIEGTNFNVTSIGFEAFYDCDALTSIEIPSGVTSIGNSAFESCSSLTSIKCHAVEVPETSSIAFLDCPSYMTIQVPAGSVEAYQAASPWKNYTILALPEIGDYTIIDYAGYSLKFTVTNVSPAECEVVCETNPTSPTAIAIPSTATVKGIECSVTSIGSYAFFACSSLTSIEIPSGVTSIGGYYAFYYCYDLENVTFGEDSQLDSIGYGAFYQCSSLESIEIPSGVTSIGIGAFAECSGLESITVEDGNTAYDSRDNCNAIIESSTNKLIAGCKNTIIPDDVTSIGDYAFYSCSSLTSIEIPSGVTSIGERAFYNCDALTSIEIPSGVTSIGDYAFQSCSSLTSIEIPSGVTSIGDYAFQYCSSLYGIRCHAEAVPNTGNYVFSGCPIKNIQVPAASVELYEDEMPWNSFNITEIYPYMPGDFAIIDYTNYSLKFAVTNLSPAECDVTCSSKPTSPTAITIPSTATVKGIECSVTSIGYEAFKNCSNLTSIEIPSGVTYIGNYAFYNCDDLTSVTFGENSQLTSIGDGAFQSCSSLTSIEIPSGVTSIGGYTFYDCDALTSIEIPSGVTSIGDDAFRSCSSLESVTFGGNSRLTSIGSSAFDFCSSLTSVSFGENSQLASIGDYAFRSCSSLESVSFGENSQLTSIGSYAFSNCDALTSIEIPSGVTSIGSYAFAGCSGLESMTVEDGNTAYDSRNNCNAIIESSTNKLIAGCKNTIIPDDVTSIGYYAFYDCDALSSIEIPSGVTSIGGEAFRYSSSLESVTFGENSQLTSIGYSAFFACSSLTSIEIPSGVTSIGNYAFYNCEALTSIEIPSGVTSIGDNAFYDCDALTSIKCHAVEVPETGSSAFNNCPENMTIQVPAGSVALYQAASPWNNYNIVAGFNSTITVSSNIAEAGSVTGGGTYTDGSSVTVSAIANTGYCFQNWTEDGEIVSYSNEYTFNVSNDRNLVANFVEYHWEPNTSYSNNMSMTAIVKIDDVEQRRTDLEIGAFCGDELRGRGILKYENSIDRYYLYLIIKGNTSDEISFRIYDHSASSELDLTHIEKIVLEVNTTIGSITSPYEFNFIAGHVRTLSSGWNWYSTYISLSGASGLNTIQTALGTAARQIKNQDAFDTYELGQWFGSLDKASTDKMYMIDMAEDEYELVITGAVVNSQECPITINKNWNWISYPVNSSMSISDALAGFTPQHGDYLKSQTAFSQYSEGNGWLGALQVLEPGEGYMYQNTSGEVKTLTYPTPNSKAELVANVTTENNYWSVNETKYPVNMNIIAVVESNGEELSDYEIGAFCEGECRGSARPIYIEALDRYMIFMTVFGDGNEEISFRLYDVSEGEEHAYTSNESMVFGVNSTIGSIGEPYVLHFGILGVEENMSNIFNVYPNPAGIDSEIYLGANCEKVEIYNTIGVKIAEYEDVSKLEGIGTAGVYVIKMHEGNDISYSRIVVR